VLADKAGMTASYLSQLETGKAQPSFDAIVTFARILGVPMYAFFLFDRDMDVPACVTEENRGHAKRFRSWTAKAGSSPHDGYTGADRIDRRRRTQFSLINIVKLAHALEVKPAKLVEAIH
jgi:transcriptional regulator with XRE-family HTH domain